MKIKRRTLMLLIRGAIKLTIVISLTSIVYSYFGTSIFTITSYQISGLDETSRLAVDTQLHILDTKKIFKVFTLNKIFTYSNGTIIDTIRDIVPEMATVAIRPIGLHTVKIDVTLLKPLFRVSDTQALTEDGIIFTTKYDIRMYPRITIASSTTKTIKSHGIIFTQLVLPRDDTNKDFYIQLSAITGKINSIIFPVEEITIESTGDVSCFNKDRSSKVIFLKDVDYKKTWSTLVSAIDTDPLKTKLATSKEKLEYLDARYDNKVFYRFTDMVFQNGNVTGILGSHAATTQEGAVSSSTIPR